MAAQRKRISAKRQEFRNIINSERLNSRTLSYFVNNNPTSTPALMHMLHQCEFRYTCTCTESRRAVLAAKVKKKKKNTMPSCRENSRGFAATRLPKARRSPEREEAVNYKSRSFKQLCRLVASFVWRLQKLIACFHPGRTRLGLLFGLTMTANNNNNCQLARQQKLSARRWCRK